MFIHYRPVEYDLKPSKERIGLVPESWRTTLPPKEGLPELTVCVTVTIVCRPLNRT